MKVLQINAVNKIASTGRTAQEMSDFLIKKGESSVVAYSKGISANPENEFVIGNIVDVKIHGLLSRISGKQGYFSYLSTKKLLRFMDDYKPDVVVLRNLHGNYINLPLLLTYLSEHDIATVAVLHDCWFYTGKCCHYTVDECYKWQSGCGNCPSLKKYNKSWFFDRTAETIYEKEKLFGAIPRLAVVGVSDWLTEDAKKAPVFKNAERITRIYNWIDFKKFKQTDSSELRKKFNLEDKKVILFAASNWSREKGIQTVLDISEKLNDNEKIILLGDLKSPIILNKNIIHISATDSVEELVKLYSLADVFVQPSLQETFGKVTAEALACGTPAVCFDSTANPEIVGENCGAVVPMGDLDSMLSEMRKIFDNGRDFYSKSCRRFVTDRFDMEQCLEQYYELFGSLISNQL